MSKKGIDFSKMADFKELEDLGNRISKSVLMCNAEHSASAYNKPKILKAGAYKQMEHLLKETPLGKNGSNWYDWYYPPGGGDLGGAHSASYYLRGRQHKAGTLARGWVSDMPEGGAARKPGKDVGKQKVDSTLIVNQGGNLHMTFYNTAPYAWAVERGHLVRLPYFWCGTPPRQGTITGFVPGQWYTMRAVFRAENDVKKAMSQELTKQLRQVVKKP